MRKFWAVPLILAFLAAGVSAEIRTVTDNYRPSANALLASDYTTNSSALVHFPIHILGLTTDGTVEEVDACNGLPVISEVQAKIHNGRAFSVSIINRDVAASGTLIAQLDTPTTCYVHLVAYYTFTGQGLAQAEVLESPTISTDGTTLTTYNRHRGKTNVSALTVLQDPSTITTGTLLENTYFGGGSIGAFGFSGSSDANIPIVLDQDKQYIIRLTNYHTTTAAMGITLLWSCGDE